MWCTQCQQDVPGVVDKHDPSSILCPRCAGLMSSKSDSPLSAKASNAAAENTLSSDCLPASDEVPEFIQVHDWQLQQELDEARRALRSLQSSGWIDERAAAGKQRRIDPAAVAEGTPAWHAREARARAAAGKRPKPARSWSFVSWTLLSLGIMAFVCGSVLMGWSFFGERSELWTLGMPITFVGQALLLVGVVLQLEGLWQDNRQTSDTLSNLDEQIHDLQHTATLLTTTQSGAAQSFYAHMAEGASPQLLLTDLKGQLDLLAVRLSQQR